MAYLASDMIIGNRFAVVSKGWSTELCVPGAKPLDCREGLSCCGIHTRISCGVKGALGCLGWSPGTHPAIRGLYGANADLSCAAYDGQLFLDGRVADEAYECRRPGIAAFGATVVGSKYYGGFPTSVANYGAGYCYLACFSPVVRARAARVLGPLPLVVDVLRVMRVIGDPMAAVRWERLESGTYHITTVGREQSGKNGDAFVEGLRVVDDGGPLVRVGADPVFSTENVDLLLRAIAADMALNDGHPERIDDGQFLLSIARGVCRGFQRFVACEARRLEDVSGRPGERVMPLLESPSKKDHGKVNCEVCGFMVVAEGHESRCRVPGVGTGIDYFFPAQMGDVSHRLDVRAFLWMTGVDKKRVGAAQDALCSGEAQAAWWSAYEGQKEQTEGSSVRARSTAFEASYHGEFRAAYKADKLNMKGCVIDADLVKFLY